MVHTSSSSFSSSSMRANPPAAGAPAGAIFPPAGSNAVPAGYPVAEPTTPSSAAIATKAAGMPPRPAGSMIVEMGTMDDHHHSETSSATGSISQPDLDVNFNAAIYSTLKQKIHDRAFVVAAQLAQLCYLTWRWYYFLITPSTLYVSLPFIIAETMIVLGGSFITYFLVWNQCRRPKLRLVDLKLERRELPTVDVMIPCYNEPVEIVRQTTLAALAMDYPKEKLAVIVCDDGNSSAMRALIAQLRADMGGSKATLRYIARKKIPGVPHHAKAGNINNALMNEGTSGEFIVIFDCDMICRPEYLQCVLPHFYKLEADALVVDERIAMVQTPQSFVNVPEDDPLGQQYRYFYGPVLHGWDAVDSTPCCGTNVTFSRKALLSVGGFTYGSITEDFLTSMTLHSHGFKTKYIHEYLAKGLSPESVHDFMKQRFRWAAGGLEIFVRNNALFKRGLSPTQKFLYFWAGFNTCLSIPMVYLIYCPIIYLLGQSKVQIATFDTVEYFVFFLPYMFLQLCCMRISYRDVPAIYLRRSLQESVFMLFCYARAVITVVVGFKLGFKVTSKDAEASEFRKSFNWCIPYVMYYFLGSMSLGFGVLNMYRAYQAPDHSPKSMAAVAVSLFWIVFIMWQMWPPIGYLLRCLDPNPQVEKASSTPGPSSGASSTSAPAGAVVVPPAAAHVPV